MQSQAIRPRQDQRTITQEQSLQAVKSMLGAGFSCIAWLRGILPVDNFVDGFVGNGPASQSSALRPASQANQVQLKTVKRGHSAEGDKLLDYLERGIFEALEKQYLKSFMFAVYLDPDDPNNIIESFTFSFSYHAVPGTDVVIPLLTSLNRKLERLSLGDPRQRNGAQHIMAAGKVPTLGEVKATVKSLIKRLIMSTQMMDDLPAKRYVTFKLFYMEGTPEDYEPPLFKAADAEKDRFFFATHDLSERPDKVSVGSMNTAFHGVSVDITSLCDILPRRNKHLEDLPFDAEVPKSQPMTHAERHTRKADDILAQKEDAHERRVVWDAEGRAYTHESLCDGDGEPDPDYEGHICDPAEEQPIGVLNDGGSIIPFTRDMLDMEVDESVHGGSQENDSDFQDQYKLSSKAKPNLDPTQPADYTTPGRGNHLALGETATTYGMDTMDLDYIPSTLLSRQPTVSGHHLSLAEQDRAEAMTVARETSPNNGPGTTETGANAATTRILRPRALAADAASTSMVRSSSLQPAVEKGRERHCCCGTNLRVKRDGDESGSWCQCEGECKRWYHVWCMGYHSIEIFQLQHPENGRRPKPWICFECRLNENPFGAFFNDGDKQTKVSSFNDLALFRLTLKIVIGSKNLPDGPSALRRRMGCSGSAANALWQRLEKEGFIAPVLEDSDSGHKTTDYMDGQKSRTKQKPRRAGRIKYTLARRTASGNAAMEAYFDNSYKMEDKIMGFKELARAARTELKRKNADVEIDSETRGAREAVESQTQMVENSLPPFPLSANAVRHEREMSLHSPRPKKKIKVSLAEHGIDVEA